MTSLVLGHLADIRSALDQRLQDEEEVYRAWKALYPICQGDTSLGETAVAQWEAMLSSQLVPEALKLIRLTLYLDTGNQNLETEIFRVAMLNMNACLLLWKHGVPKANGYERHSESSKIIKLIVDECPPLIAKWWLRYRHLARSWVELGRFMPHCTSFVTALYHLSQCYPSVRDTQGKEIR